MKKSEIKEELKELRKSQSFMLLNNSGREDYRAAVATRIQIYEKLLKEGYDEKS